MTDIEKSKMIAAIKLLNQRIKDATGFERERLVGNRDFLSTRLLPHLEGDELLTSGILNDFAK